MPHPTQHLLFCGLLVAASHACFGGEGEVKNSDVFRPNGAGVVSLERLERLRGGFETPSGLTVSFGVIRTVSINGDVVNRTSFNLPDVAQISPEQARLANAALTEASVVQNGAGNQVARHGGDAPRTGGTLIQNSLNDQTIQTRTVINAGVNSLGLFKSLNLQTALKDALLGAFNAR